MFELEATMASMLPGPPAVASLLGLAWGELKGDTLPCKARRAASWRRARDGAMARGGGMLGVELGVELAAPAVDARRGGIGVSGVSGVVGGEKMESAEREEGA